MILLLLYLFINICPINIALLNITSSSGDVIVNGMNNMLNSSSSNIIENTTTNQEWFIKDALKDIAYYLRAHKFREYDRRYETDRNTAKR